MNNPAPTIPLTEAASAQWLRRHQGVHFFAYGTLMRGDINHSVLEGIPCVGEATLPGWELYSMDYWPALVGAESAWQSEVYGEIYRFDAENLHVLTAVLDMEERAGYVTVTDIARCRLPYWRQSLPVIASAWGGAWEGLERIDSGNWKQWQEERDERELAKGVADDLREQVDDLLDVVSGGRKKQPVIGKTSAFAPNQEAYERMLDEMRPADVGDIEMWD